VIATRSGRVVVRAGSDGVVVRNGAATTAPDGTITVGSTSGSGAVEVVCPVGADVVVGTQSGRVELHGSFGSVSVSTASGRVAIDDADEVDVRTSSGRVEVGRCAGGVRCAVSSGRVTIGHASSVDVSVRSGSVEIGDALDARIHAASGRVKLSARGGGDVHVRTTSGRVSVTVPSGCCPDAHLHTTNGRIDNDVPAGGDGRVIAESVSGRVSLAWR
jgi:DUF4097 and DUF4098 domain-containing protein YvlB